MAQRRTWAIAGAAAVLVAGGVAAWMSATAGPLRPLHFWVREGEDLSHLRASPDGAEVTTWDVDFDPDDDSSFFATARPTAFERISARFGLAAAPDDDFCGMRVQRPGTPAGWREYVVTSASLLREPVLDPSLAGHWRPDLLEPDLEVEPDEDWMLEPDGTARSETGLPCECRWGRVGDVLVFFNVEGGRWAVDVTAVVAPDGESLLGGLDEEDLRTYRRVR